MRIQLLAIIALLLLCVKLHAQQMVKGKIVSKTQQQPIAGVAIKLEGTNSITQSDERGEFSISLGAGTYKISFSHVNFHNVSITTVLPSQALLNIEMEQNIQELAEVTVVNTGYQKLARERSIGSYSAINAVVLNEQKGSNLLARLENIASGLMADRNTSASNGRLMVRGLSSIRGVKEPLIVVDNFPYEGDLNNLNPNDVESISILKDALASSIWGARAGNGVIVITTKTAKYKQNLNISIGTNLAIGSKMDLTTMPQMASADFIEVERLLYGKGYYNSQINAIGKPALSPVVELLLAQTNGQLSKEILEEKLVILSKHDVRADFSKYLYQRSFNQQYSLRIGAGAEKYNWNINLGYDKNKSELAAGYNRLSNRLSLNLKPIRGLEIQTGLALTMSNSSGGKPSINEVTSKSGSLYPYAKLADDFGNPLPIVKDYRFSYIDTAGRGKLLDWKYYPLSDYQKIENQTKLVDIILNTGLSYKLFSFLSANVKYQYQRQQNNNRVLNGIDSYSTREIINRYTQMVQSQTVRRIPLGAILNNSDQLVTAQNVRGQLDFNQQFSNHQIDMILGTEVRSIETSSQASRIYGYNPEVLTFATIDYVNLYPNYITGSGAYIPDGNNLQANANRFISAYGNLAYTYSGKYSVFASGRRDASNLFGVNTNDKWNLLWSAGAAWEVSKESFFKTGFLTYLKLRTSYGISGNVDPAMSAVTTIAYQSNSVFTQSPFARFGNFFNPELKWETVAMLNLGLDFKMWNNRIVGSIDYFDKRTSNLFGSYPLDYTAGIGTTIIKNIASTKGNGVDLVLNSLNINSVFKWSSALNLSYYKDRIKDYYVTSLQGSRFISTTTPDISGVIGKPIYSMFSYPWAGLDPTNGDPRGVFNGAVSKDYAALMGPNVLVSDLVYHGPVLPVYYGTIGNTISYKNWDLTARVLFKAGYHFRKSTINYANLIASWRGHADYANRWQNPGDEQLTDVPSFAYPNVTNRDLFYNGAEVLVRRGDHLRLQYLTLNYNLKSKLLSKMAMSRLGIYANVSNLGLLWTANKEGIDPEYQKGLRPPKTYSFGLNANF